MPTGDPAAAAQALLEIVDLDNPPLRVLFGQGFYQIVQQAYADRLEDGPLRQLTDSFAPMSRS